MIDSVINSMIYRMIDSEIYSMPNLADKIMLFDMLLITLLIMLLIMLLIKLIITLLISITLLRDFL